MLAADEASAPLAPALSADELRAVRVVIIVCNALSIFGCAFILWHFLRSGRAGFATSLSQRMVVTLSLLDLSYSFPKVFAHPNEARDKLACDAQGFTLEFTGLMSVVWNCCMAHSMYRKAVYRDSEDRLLSRFKLYVCLTFFPAFGASVGILAGDMFGDAIFYCWVANKHWHLLALYLWVVLAIGYVTGVLFVTHRHVSRRARHQSNLDAIETSWAIMLKLRIYMVAFVVLWLPSAVFRLVGDKLGDAQFAVAIAMQLTLCSQGFATSIIYGGLVSKLRALCRRKPPAAAYRAITPPIFPADTALSPSLLKSFGRPASIFVSTFNMGEGKLSKTELGKWVPRGYDIYVIGVQECLHLSETRRLIRHHIEGRTSPSAPASGHIAITVFIKAEDVESGAFYMPPAAQQQANFGTSLVVARASNKGAVGFAFRYYDTSFAFATCHLSSDSKGRSKVTRRNRDAVDMLTELHLNAEDVGFEFPLMHHHSFVLGDLNYRMTHRDASPQAVLELVASIQCSEAASSSGGSAPSDSGSAAAVSSTVDAARRRWSSWRSNLLSSTRETRTDTNETATSLDASVVEHLGNASPSDDVDYIVGVDLESSGSADEREASRGAGKLVWADLLAHDELTNWMASGQVFFGFREAQIAFPPSYRRKRGVGLRPDARWTATELAKQYTTAVKGAGVRVPSYTDRILYTSQADVARRLKCSLYALCEDVKCSDHKPVVAVFHARVNRTYEPMPRRPPAPPRKWRRMQNISGVYECTLKVSFRAVQWHIVPAPFAPEPALPHASRQYHQLRHDGGDESKRLDQVVVTIVFPLPSEDIFSEQRKLHELADSLSGGVYSAGSDELLLKSNVAHRKWPDFVRDGLSHATFARVTSAMHVAIKVHASGAKQCFGQGVVSLPPECVADDDVGGGGDAREFEAELSVGGKCTGTLSGSLHVCLVQHD
ncbi:hypothetical protein PybrP1_012930 [[Pythium] brassicae (nom. inval.)]|nr:hypothetical protein PybrP1_012930 [[Pythium] brassicae (nom. inval.)]